MRVGWRQHIERGLGMSEGPGHVQRNGVLGGHGATHRVSPSVGQFTWTRGWRRRRVVGVQTRAHKHGGHGRHDIEAVEMVVTARQRWAGQQFFRRGVTHMRPPGHMSGPGTLTYSWCLSGTCPSCLPDRDPALSIRPPAKLPSTHCGTHPSHLPDRAPALSVCPPAKPPSTHCGTRPGCLPHVCAQGTCHPAHSPTH